ncbi:uncharacterized protein MYCFIDRAFT_177543 [Pseudocercospora fijiensis CIRAD86]|uniref:Uncharacterized protein n=1 Tax=Pseudocercospora fijiensis (strain CIRAD86) TaxID=383855 RepID=M3ASZ5_PSEFD|nr:uncharacterized protein MYCFIDRAFT_177543 [Pseudocercospora fijiensis CIRAD86]EME80612.1 hypothetical protein MYCFIDRAFT_177543 [Pseudocercospora fijiensis CIRAD86]
MLFTNVCLLDLFFFFFFFFFFFSIQLRYNRPVISQPYIVKSKSTSSSKSDRQCVISARIPMVELYQTSLLQLLACQMALLLPVPGCGVKSDFRIGNWRREDHTPNLMKFQQDVVQFSPSLPSRPHDPNASLLSLSTQSRIHKAPSHKSRVPAESSADLHRDSFSFHDGLRSISPRPPT